jgi:outer membrane immunogenic protein
MTIRNLIAALGVLSLSSAGAMAADLAYKAPPPPAPPPPSWTGFYIGVNGGASWATAANAINLGGLGVGIAGTLPLYSQGLNGYLAGGQIGYNYQSGKFLVGVEGDGDWSNIKGTTPCLVVFTCNANMQWTADATVRAGVLPMQDLLVYVKGGASWTSVKYNFSDGGLLAPFASITSNATETKVGGLLGFGTEYMFAPHWTAKLEYNYVDYGKHTDNHPLTLAVGPLAATINVPVQSSLQAHTMKAGINYLF